MMKKPLRMRRLMGVKICEVSVDSSDDGDD